MLRTKLVCTLGPATFSAEMIRRLVDSGMTMARLNMSHGLRDDHQETVELIRRASEEAGTPVAILVDLGGPKIRVGRLASPLFLAEGAEVIVSPQETALEGEIPTTYARLADDVVIGDRVLLDDGLLELRCVGKGGGKARFVVECGGRPEQLQGHERAPAPTSALPRSPTGTGKTSNSPSRRASNTWVCRSCAGARTSWN